MAGKSLKKSGYMYKRMNMYAKELKEFTTLELKEKMNGTPAYLNNESKSPTRTTKMQITSQRLSSLLKGNPNVRSMGKKYINKVGLSDKYRVTVWKWIGDEE
tara:strand:+ start:1895 stop:2200 length:306 start_codon:yes stop_codon:yes gene_type:complete